MGKILPSFKKALVDEIVQSISSNTSQYYAFAANPVAYTGDSVPNVANSDYDTTFINNWQLMFGKKINSADISPVIRNKTWVSNTVYDRYDNTSETLYSNANFYVISEPSVEGGSYHVYKCIDNSSGGRSTVDPGTIGTPTQSTSFTTADGYRWRYIYSITSKNYERFASSGYVPVYRNPTISSLAYAYAGVEVVNISNSGIGYSTYHEGTVLANPNSTFVQIQSTASENNDFYVNNAIYIYNEFEATSQIRTISSYISNTSGKFVFFTPAVNTALITPGISQYKISPRVVFETDGDIDPVAYTTINTTSNSINSVVILDIGSNISRANVYIQGNTAFGSGANVYAIVPPSGGHGFDPSAELDVQGLAINFSFANTEGNSIVTSNTLYNKIGLIKDPYTLVVNTVSGVISKGTAYNSTTFDQILKANVNPSYTFSKGEVVTGNTTGSKGTVVFSNTTTVYLTGDKTFANGEYISNNAGNFVTTIEINEVADVYSKDLKPFYVENINNVNRLDEQTESYRLTIKF